MKMFFPMLICAIFSFGISIYLHPQALLERQMVQDGLHDLCFGPMHGDAIDDDLLYDPNMMLYDEDPNILYDEHGNAVGYKDPNMLYDEDANGKGGPGPGPNGGYDGNNGGDGGGGFIGGGGGNNGDGGHGVAVTTAHDSEDSEDSNNDSGFDVSETEREQRVTDESRNRSGGGGNNSPRNNN